MTTTTRIDPTVWVDDPAAFMSDCLGAEFYPKQVAMAESVRDHRRTAVLGCNSSGKDYAAGRIILWWQSTRYPAKTIVLGPTHRQVSDIVWQEARAAYRVASYRAAPGLGGFMYPRASRWYADPQHYALGFATDDAMHIQGFHSPNLLAVLTEAHAITQQDIEAVKRLNPSRILLTGNPLSAAGEFFEAFHPVSAEQAGLYSTITISAYDTPNLLYPDDPPVAGMVTAEDIAERRAEWGEESALYVAGILGRFPDSLDDAVVPRNLLLEAVDRPLPAWNEDQPPRGVLSVDVARFGADKTVIYRRQGGRCTLVGRWQGRDTQEVAGLVGKMAVDDNTIERIVVDDSGVGGGVTDRLRENPPRNALGQVMIVAFNGGESARRSDRYVNAITEAWMELAGEFRSGLLSIDNNPALIGQLSSRRYTIQGDRRMKLEPKKDFKTRSGYSPDDADALAMSTAGVRGGPNIRWI